MSVVCSLAVGFGLALLAAAIAAGYYYELRHPIPAGEDDLGIGLMVVLWSAAMFLLSIPLMIWLIWVFKRAIIKLLIASTPLRISNYMVDMNLNIAWWIYTIISPIYFYASYITVSAFHINKIHEILNKIVAITEVVILCVFFIYPIYLAIKKKTKKSFIFVLTQLLAFVVCIRVFNFYEINMDKIDFKINENNYRSLIESTTPFRVWGDKRLFLIKIDSHYMNCTRYFVYDESHEFANPKNEFFGIGYVYATAQNGERFHSSDFDVRVKRYGDLTYITDVCP